MLTLLIDTSHEKSLIAFAHGFDILLTVPLPVGLQSSIHLFPLIRSGFQQLKLKPDALEAIAVSVGPGSFTGIRVGVAAAKGIAAPKNLPLIPLCSLHGFMGEGTAVIDAKIGGAYVLHPGAEAKYLPASEVEKFEKIVGPDLRRFACKDKIERYPDPSTLLKNRLYQKRGDLELLYLNDLRFHPDISR